MSFPRSGTVQSRSACCRPTRPRRAAPLARRCRRDALSFGGMPGWSPETKRPLAAARTTTARSESTTTGHPMVGRSTSGTTTTAAIKFRRCVRRLAMRRCRNGGRRGHSPPPAPLGDSRSVAPVGRLAERRNGRPTSLRALRLSTSRRPLGSAPARVRSSERKTRSPRRRSPSGLRRRTRAPSAGPPPSSRSGARRSV